MQKFLGVLVLLGAACAASPATGVRADPYAPGCWRELAYEAKSAWASAASTLRYEARALEDEKKHLLEVRDARPSVPGAERVGTLRASFEAMRSLGELQIWYDLQTGGLLQAQRIGHGSQSRMKVYRLVDTGVWRERRAPDKRAEDADPSGWPLRSRGLLSYPDGLRPESSPLLIPEMLIERAATLAQNDRSPVSMHLVLNDTQFYRASLRLEGRERIDADFRLDSPEGKSRIKGKRDVRRVRVEPRVLGEEPERDAFTLMELSGDLDVYVDEATGLPLRIQGRLMRFGTIPVALLRAEIAADCAR